MAAIHMHLGNGEEDANTACLSAMPGLQDAVLVSFARREQGLVTSPSNPMKLARLADVAASAARLGMRQGGAGAQLLFEAIAAAEGLDRTRFVTPAGAFPTGQDLAFAIRSGEIDCGLATHAVATANGLAFSPLAWERFDLAMRRRSYFEPGPQKLFALMRDPEFGRHATLLTGYDTADAGKIRLNC